jgi:hypothetical protein
VAVLLLEGEADVLGETDCETEVVWERVFLELVEGLLEVDGLDEYVENALKVNPGDAVWTFVSVGVWLSDTEAVEE